MIAVLAEKTIIHVDMDAFYASVEQLDNPEFRGLPVIVGADPGSGRGVVAACSYEARRYGIHSALPIGRAKRLCPDGIFVRPRMARYAQLSAEIFALFNRFTDLVEPLSVDEAFLDVTGSLLIFGDGVAIARQIKALVKEETGLVCSVGVAPNKFIAKIASDLEKPDGLVYVKSENLLDFLHPLPITRLWGVGEKTAALLSARGLRTIGDVAGLTVEAAKMILGDHGEHLHRLSRGIDEREVVPEREVKSIGNEVTFDHDTSDEELIKRTLLALSDKVAGRLRNKGFEAAGITLKFRDSNFKTVTRSISPETPTAVTDHIFEEALRLLKRTSYRTGMLVRLVGVTASRLVPAGAGRQGELFEVEKDQRLKRADHAVDDIRRRFGMKMVKRGVLVGSSMGKKSREQGEK
jgi:nucleotidyltransferase/DNA polymerase involved in DNA repair